MGHDLTMSRGVFKVLKCTCLFFIFFMTHESAIDVLRSIFPGVLLCSSLNCWFLVFPILCRSLVSNKLFFNERICFWFIAYFPWALEGHPNVYIAIQLLPILWARSPRICNAVLLCGTHFPRRCRILDRLQQLLLQSIVYYLRNNYC